MTGKHRMSGAPCSAPRIGHANRPDETDIVDVSDLAATRLSGPGVRSASRRSNRAERRSNHPWMGKSDSGSVGMGWTAALRARVLNDACIGDHVAPWRALPVSTKRFARRYRARRESSGAVAVTQCGRRAIAISEGTHGRGGRSGRAVNNSVYNMFTGCADVRRSEASSFRFTVWILASLLNALQPRSDSSV